MHMKHTRSIALAAAGALAFVASSCGSSDSAKTPTKAAYISDANAICKKGNDQLSKASEKLSKATKAQQQAFVKKTVVPNIQAQIDDIQALGYPKGDKDTLSKQYDAMNDVLDSWAK